MHSPAVSSVQKFAAPLRQQALDNLRQAIIDGRLAPGARLTERELTEMLGVSRTVVREALRSLEAEGLVHVIPNKGPVVRALTAAEAEDLYQIRAVLEGLAARLFVEHASARQIEQLAKALEVVAEAYRSGDAARVLETKNRFYDVLFVGAGSETLSSMLATLHARIWRWRALGLTHPDRSYDRSRESITQLRKMVETIRAGDRDAAERITRDEANMAAQEVMRLLASTASPTGGRQA